MQKGLKFEGGEKGDAGLIFGKEVRDNRATGQWF